jgi:binding-protein-dependent transport system inner membrane component
MVRHVAPNVVAPIIVLTSLAIGTTILVSAALSFLGLGAQPPLPDWGGMINQGRAFLRTAWWVGMFPGLAIMLTVLGFNLIGDGPPGRPRSAAARELKTAAERPTGRRTKPASPPPSPPGHRSVRAPGCPFPCVGPILRPPARRARE